jgi:hypothetical protein
MTKVSRERFPGAKVLIGMAITNWLRLTKLTNFVCLARDCLGCTLRIRTRDQTQRLLLDEAGSLASLTLGGKAAQCPDRNKSGPLSVVLVHFRYVRETRKDTVRSSDCAYLLLY